MRGSMMASQQNTWKVKACALLLTLLVIAYVVYVQWIRVEKQIGGAVAPPQCASSADCPAQTECGHHGYCLPVVPDITFADPTGGLGRGRKGEGENVYTVYERSNNSEF